MKNDIFKMYLDNNSISNKVLYKKSNNWFGNIFNYFFNRYGILKIVRFDGCHIFTIYKKGIEFISIKYYDYSFNSVDVTFRGLIFENSHVVKASHFNSFAFNGYPIKVARSSENKQLIVEYFNKMLIGAI